MLLLIVSSFSTSGGLFKLNVYGYRGRNIEAGLRISPPKASFLTKEQNKQIDLERDNEAPCLFI
jgi:hypothetical protein